MRGIPQTEVKHITPTANRNEHGNLNSIEEVQTEHYWKENGSRYNSNHKEQANAEPESLSHIDNLTQPQSLVFKNNYKVIDENDGKSS